MEEKKELSEILLGNTKRSSSGKKAVFVVLAAIAIIVIVAFLMWKFLSGKEEPLAKPSGAIDTEIMKPADDQFTNNFGGFDFQQNDPKLDDTYGGLPQDFTMGFEEPSQDPQAPIENQGTNIDDVLKNITDTIKPEPQATNNAESKEPQKPVAASPAPKPTAPAAPAPKPAATPAKSQAQNVAPAQNPAQNPVKDSAQKKPEPKKESKAPESKEPQKPSPAPKPAQSTPAATPIAPAPSANNGGNPTQGFYWQVGAFEKEPSAEFLTLIKKYSYRIQHVVFDNKPNTRYLLGPYRSKAQAPNREEIAEIFKENPIPVEVP